jgi:hypothetical protein
MSNIINLTWNGATDDNGISGYQIQWRTSTTSPWSQPPILVNHNTNSPGNTPTSGGGSYNHTITQVRDHTFRIRIIDSVGQFSAYKTITVSVDTSTILISSQGSQLGNNRVCTLNTFNPINPILLKDNNVATTDTIVDNLTFVKKDDGSVFDGELKFWRILLNNISYRCKIDTSGMIQSHVQCSSNVKTFNISSQGYDSNITNGPICVADLFNTIYFNNELEIGTIIYTTLNENGALSDIFIGNNKYYLIGNYDFYYIIQIQSNGSVSSIQDYTAVCQLNDPIEIVICCFVKGTKITMFDYTTKNIEDVKIGDIVITYNEETKLQEPGEVTNIASPVKNNIVEYKLSNDVIIKSTTCHPYWVIGKGWSSFDKELTKKLYDFDVEQILENDILLTIDNKKVIVDKITELITKEVTTYNLEILGNHTYYANGILVHNKTTIPPEPPKFDQFGNQTSEWTTWNNLYSSVPTCTTAAQELLGN